jgi:enoyl-[acyl-carrier protein] reductase I
MGAAEMIPLDLSGKVALVTGVGNDYSFAWFIAKALQAAGARLLFSVHPRMYGMVKMVMEGERDAEQRVLPFGRGTLQVEKMFPCDVSYDTPADIPEAILNERKYNKNGPFSIQDMMEGVRAHCNQIDILVHSVAFSSEIKKPLIETTRGAYLNALSISSYSLIALSRAVLPLMEGRGGSVIGLTYLGGARVVPHYGGGMGTAKAALELDAKYLASNLGPKNIRVNLISAGPYASLAAQGIGDIEKMKSYAAERSPLPRPITAEEVANTAVFLCSPLASGITGEVLYVDCGYNVMGV